MTPREVLENQLYKYQRALHKSADSLKAGQITPELHRIHRTNLEPKINLFEQAVKCLKENNII